MAGTPTYISTNTTTTVVSGAGVLDRIILNETAAGAITIKDGDTTFAVLKASIAEQTFEFGMRFKTSLVIVTAASSKLTVITS